MINARTLMRGNYLHTNTTYKQVEVIQPLIVAVDEIKHLKASVTYVHKFGVLSMTTTHLYYHQLKGIHLTDEILLKFGFAQNGDYWNKGLVELCKKYYGSNELMYSATGHTIEYVHLLQNFYIALTGEELVIKDL